MSPRHTRCDVATVVEYAEVDYLRGRDPDALAIAMLGSR